MKDNLRFDRARVQMGKISGFGLLELSRQRRRTGVLEGTSHVCEHCQGAGRVRSVESAALSLLRTIDEAAARNKNHAVTVQAPTDVALYLLNEKRETLAAIEARHDVRVRVTAASDLRGGDFGIATEALQYEGDDVEAEPDGPRAKSPRRDAAPASAPIELDETEDDAEPEDSADEEREEDRNSERSGRRRRGRRGGRRRRGDETEAQDETPPASAPQPRRETGAESQGGRRRRRGRGRNRRVYEVDGGEWLDFVSADLKHLSPRPEQRPPRQIVKDHAVAAAVQPEPEPVPSAVPTPHSEQPVAMPAPEPFEPAAFAADTPDDEPQGDPYEPDQERRDKFFSRLSRWAKKSG
jgi:ribonuclease E